MSGEKKLDVLPIVDAYEVAIAAQLEDRGDRRRFVKIRALCKQADELMRLMIEEGGRVGNFGLKRNVNPDDCDDSAEDGFGGGMQIGHLVGAGPEPFVRELVAAVGPLLGECARRTRAEADRASAQALEALCRARRQLKNGDVAEIDAKIRQLREEMRHGDDLVRPVLLRGREAREEGEVADGGQVGEAHGGGAGGHGGPVEAGGRPGVDPQDDDIPF